MMGQWGFYDDEGDSVADMAIDIEHKVLPKRLQSCYQYDKIVKVPCRSVKTKKAKEEMIQRIIKDFEEELPKGKKPYISTHIDATKKCEIHLETERTVRCYVERKKYLEDNRDKLGAEILKSIENEKVDGYYRQPEMIAGIALYLARNWQSTPIFPMNRDTVDRGYSLPEKLPVDFPEKLRKMAHDASVKQLETFDNKMNWSEPEKRIQALKNQIKLFL